MSFKKKSILIIRIFRRKKVDIVTKLENGYSTKLSNLTFFSSSLSKNLTTLKSNGCFSCRLCEHSTAAKAAVTKRYNIKRVAL
jgi:hypothetical protein